MSWFREQTPLSLLIVRIQEHGFIIKNGTVVFSPIIIPKPLLQQLPYYPRQHLHPIHCNDEVQLTQTVS